MIEFLIGILIGSAFSSKSVNIIKQLEPNQLPDTDLVYCRKCPTRAAWKYELKGKRVYLCSKHYRKIKEVLEKKNE